MRLVATEGKTLGIALLCAALALSRATFYRDLAPKAEKRPRKRPARRLSDDERAKVATTLGEPRFVDLAPAEVYATLLDEGTYFCSERTMYRVLEENAPVRERRDQLAHGKYAVPELLATKANQLWSWDITKLLGPATWTYFYLYVIMDVFSRYVVGWMVAHAETAVLADKLISETCEHEGIVPGQPTLHADRGSPMKSKQVAFLLSDLGVTKTHSRPHVSNDNPFSEAHFKTMKYRPDFPDKFGSLVHARSFLTDFFSWYNEEHHHEGIGLLTPSDVHHGRAEARLEARANVMSLAFNHHPERFPGGRPRPQKLPQGVWTNKPKPLASSALADLPPSEEPRQ